MCVLWPMRPSYSGWEFNPCGSDDVILNFRVTIVRVGIQARLLADAETRS